MAVLQKSCAHAGDDGFGRAEFFTYGCGVRAKINYVLGESLALYANDRVVALCRNGDNVKVDGRRNDTAVVVVGVVARELASAGNGEKIYLALAVKRFEFLDRADISLPLVGDCALAVNVSKLCVKLARIYVIYHF